eukprot:1191211-Prorocentrum_minimum.AAC.3
MLGTLVRLVICTPKLPVNTCHRNTEERGTLGLHVGFARQSYDENVPRPDKHGSPSHLQFGQAPEP